jgi:hypothetical protein
MKTIILTAATIFAALLTTQATAHADDPVRCKDVPGPFSTGHICQFPDGSVTNCISSALPVMGPPCVPVYTALTPGFWNSP